MEKFTFGDAQQMQKDHPNTFEAPTLFDLDKIKEKDYVKVCAEPTNGEHAERFWVIVQKIKGNKITGIINNDLIFTEDHGLKCDDVITFEKKHVYSLE